jgi:hypothetical protein
LQTLEGYIFYIFYNFSQPNFAILLILVCPSREYKFLAKIKISLYNGNCLLVPIIYFCFSK